ncbi:MAG: GGDEF/response regulator receiver domain protein [Candidatus Ozemobacter sibiricus]|jgi:diguanylate cyclase (GGDEF)-like protein|uniref:GGDEF/response regulator receiver domain protein n=1 Tax=Candidatus Ozemobacter sibiricus TaxID=2268124 RepID=A0A367ZR34_9BACT|nr:MAG: GGDEF/response regulator receiver domain protein [Candidatus Ozemobacter sibiricus]
MHQTATLRRLLTFHASLARQTARTASFDTLLRFLLNRVLALVQAHSGSILIYDAQADRLLPWFSAGHPAQATQRRPPTKAAKTAPAARPARPERAAPLPVDDGVASRVLHTGQPLFVDDLHRADPALPLRRRAAGGSFLSVPLQIHRRTIGVLNLNRRRGEPGFTPDDLALIQTIVPHLAALVEKGRLLSQLAARKEEVETLYELSRRLFSGAPFPTALRQFLRALVRHLDLERAAVIRFGAGPSRPVAAGGASTAFRPSWEAAGSPTVEPASRPTDPEAIELLAGVAVSRARLATMLTQVRRRLRRDLAKERGPAGWDDHRLPPPVALPYQEGGRQKDMFVIPLPLAEDRIHALLVSSDRPTLDNEPAVQRYRFLHLVSKQLAVAIEREAMLERIQADQATLLDNNLQSSIFLNISQELASTLDPTVVLRKAFDQFRRLISFTTISILMYDDLEKTHRLIVQPARPIGLGFQRALRHNIMEIFRDYPADPPLTDPASVAMEVFHPQDKGEGAAGRGARLRHVLHLPFILGERVVGLIHLTRSEGPAFSGRDLSTTSQFTGIFITSIKNALIHRRTEKLAFTDPLTGLFNHRYFQETLAQEFLRARRYGKPLSLMILDIDFFKKFNDTYGHLLGDKVLVHCARLFEKSVREKIDTVARYGGEEFAVLLPETGLDGAAMFAERIRRTVASTPLQADVGTLPITLSIGVACTAVTTCPQTSDLIQAADLALYEAKEGGRNRVVRYERAEVEHA